MITAEEINSAFAESGQKMMADFKSRVAASYGPMSDSAAGLLLSIGTGADIKLPSGRIVTREEVSMCLGAGFTPDQILETLRKME